MNKRYAVWVEISANKEWILDAARFGDVMRRCRQIGVTEIILSVKDTTGFALYPSRLAPHYARYDPAFEADVDYVAQCYAIIRECGMKCYASFDVFAAGNRVDPHPLMPGLCKEGFACEVYGLDEAGNPVIAESTQAAGLHTVGSIDDFGEIFLNPGNEEVRAYALDLLQEFVEAYHPDGIVLDRVRYVGLSTDFSERSRLQWEAYSGVTGEQWPEDIYTIVETEDGYVEQPGPYYGSFLTWRMQVIHDFVCEVSRMLKAYPEVEFCDYTGSWYPLYYRVGANWAGTSYKGRQDFPWCKAWPLRRTAYAGALDTLMSGCYYPDVTVQEAAESQRPADWYSVEGAADLAARVAGEGVTIVDSLFLDQYRECLPRIPQAIDMCRRKSAGCMLFDLSYLVRDDWWDYALSLEESPLSEQDRSDVTALCAEIFPAEYMVTEQRIRTNLFEDPEWDPACSVCLRDAVSGALIGFAGVKVAANQELYPDTAWISICGVAGRYQGHGYGTLIVQRTLENLRQKGIRKVYLGQDFSNFFSGIPAPDAGKEAFFQHLGFTLNDCEHYDLEGSTTGNARIEYYDTRPWATVCMVTAYHGERAALLSFLEQEFPGRWRYEAEMALQEGKPHDEIMTLWPIDHSRLLGYCMLSVDRDEQGAQTGRGGLGPIGIAQEIRGRHVGDYLLHESLVQLRRLGVRTVNIDWTILRDFYGQFDFYAARTYRAAYMDL